MKARSIELTLAALLMACGGASQAPATENASDAIETEAAPESETAGDESEGAVASQEAPAEIPMSGPGSLIIDAKVRGESTPASVRLLDSNGQETATGNAGEPIKAPAGDYTLEIKIADAKSMFDTPTQRRQLVLSAGKDLHETADFPWAMVQLNVRINGKFERNAEVTLLREGEEIGTLKSGADHVRLSPGRYQAIVKARGAKMDVPVILIPEGATQSVPVDVRM